MLFITITHPTDSGVAPVVIQAKNTNDALPKVQDVLERFNISKSRGTFKKHDLDMILAGEKCEPQLSSFQRILKALVSVRRVPHRTYKGQLLTLAPPIA